MKVCSNVVSSGFPSAAPTGRKSRLSEEANFEGQVWSIQWQSRPGSTGIKGSTSHQHFNAPYHALYVRVCGPHQACQSGPSCRAPRICNFANTALIEMLELAAGAPPHSASIKVYTLGSIFMLPPIRSVFNPALLGNYAL